MKDSHASRKMLQPAWNWLDRIGLALQMGLVALGIHMQLATGFSLRLGAVHLHWRHPTYGLLLIVVGTFARWPLSQYYRGVCERRHERFCRSLSLYAREGRRVPWGPAFWWVIVPSLIVYQSTERTIGWHDSEPAILTAVSLVQSGDLNLDEFVDPSRPCYSVYASGSHYYTRFSLGPAFLAVPYVQICEWLGGDLRDPILRHRFEKIVSSQLAAMAVGIMFLVFVRLADLRVAVVLTLLFAFGSQQWIVSSQALWQHGPVVLMLSMVLLIECRGMEVTSAGRALQGLLLGFAVGCRPTAVLLLGSYLIVIRRGGWRAIGSFATGVMAIGLPFLLMHLALYGSVLGPYRDAGSAGAWKGDYATALLGNLASPARGLLIYCPWVVAILTARRLPQDAGFGAHMRWALGLWCVVHFLIVSRFGHWWGGHCWGPRFLTELTPALLVLAIPAISRWWPVPAGRLVIVLALLWSVYVQALAAYAPSATKWVYDPVDIDKRPERLWDWHDPPFLYPWRAH